jgi:4-amino-4-deoxy-L-arabinose transferase-like glycosyltransferase
VTAGPAVARPVPSKRPDVPRATYRRALAGVLLAAAAVRLWSIDFGLPLLHARPDERALLATAVQFAGGDLNPGSFHAPSLSAYLLSGCYGAWYMVGRSLGSFRSLADFTALYELEPGGFLLISRLLAVLLGIATVYATARLAESLFDRRHALIAAALFGFTFLHVRDSHFGASEVPMTLFVTISMLFIVRTLERGRNSDYLLAGLFAGLAASTRYAGVLLVFPMLWAHAADLPGRGREQLRGFFDVKLCGFAAALVGAFLVGTPFALLDVSAFWRDLATEPAHLVDAHRVDVGLGWIHHATVSLWYGMGWPLWLVALAGFVQLVRSDRRDGVLLAAFPAAYFLFMGGGEVLFARTTIPLLPFLAIAAAWLLHRAAERLAEHIARPRDLCLAGLAGLALLPSLASIAWFGLALGQRDNRLVVLDWLAANAPAESSVFQTGPGEPMDGRQWARVPLVPSAARLELRRAALQGEGKSPQELQARIAYMRRPGAPVPFDEWGWSDAQRTFTSFGEPVGGLPTYILVARHPLRRMPEPPPALLALVAAEYELVKVFRAVTPEPGVNVYDDQDALFVPLAGFRGLVRPGPNFEVYRRGGFSAVARR